MRCGVTVQYPFPVEWPLHSKTGRTCDRHETAHCHSFKSDCWSFSVELQATDMSISVGIILSLFIRIKEDENLALGCLDCVPRIRGRTEEEKKNCASLLFGHPSICILFICRFTSYHKQLLSHHLGSLFHKLGDSRRDGRHSKH